MKFWKHLCALAVLLSALVLCSCKKQADQTFTSAPVSADHVEFQVKGVVKELKPDGKTVSISHEAIPNYMAAMTMDFEVHDTNELRGLKPGDAIKFQLTVNKVTGWISHVAKLDTMPGAQLPSRASMYVTRDVEPLNLGDVLPNYHFTNELGQAVDTDQFKGQALVFTFFFTTCPFPTFCPLLSRNFEDAQGKMLALKNAPQNWHLLSISFDTEHDTPAVLKDYAQRYQYDPAHWSFVTGQRLDITAIGDQVGAYFGHDENGGIVHNLRTVVVDAKGRIQKVYQNNNWTGDDLAAEIIKACAPQ